ncbi:STAS-like domain-containing protein [Arenimonas composti]|uniref:DUF4325 domain-containing protein n=1 Tax=Arenimonas composti TR7-09 = DSM 18010 TaxID=1121013 RepID=A0A091BWL3_9GAMM|nr:DUF4325 domain-containing protein [Arenimonas composti]KFN48735.1 hypothetical protein P873_13845 [Arenimonas composti TR7-09 = DSM 18010]
MARPSRRHEIDSALLAAVGAHPRDLVRVVMNALGLSRPQVLARVDALIDAGFLARDDNPTRPSYRHGPRRRHSFTRAVAGAEEHVLWEHQLAPLLAGLPRNVYDICHYGFTEMVNNVVDHSGGRRLVTSVDLEPGRVAITVQDDGVGIFRKISRHLALPDERLALLELAKGKLTTDPRRHSGEGVFFTSRVFDHFMILSGGLSFDHDHRHPEDVLFDDDDGSEGTTVVMEIADDSRRTCAGVFARFSSGPEDYSFARTIVPVRMAGLGDGNLVSRSQARRVLQRVDRFRIVVFDFAAVTAIGQGFADEIFRVFAAGHPEVELEFINADAAVVAMIRRAQAAAAESWRIEEAQGDLFEEPKP